MYLSSIDYWYQRHIYVPFFSRPYAPRLEFNLRKNGATFRERLKKSMTSSEFGGVKDDSIPIMMTETLMKDYLLEAEKHLEINIYEV